MFLFYFCLQIFSMLLVRRSDRNWQLTKSLLQEVDMWNMWESISCAEENDCTASHITKYTVQLYILYSMCSLYIASHMNREDINWVRG